MDTKLKRILIFIIIILIIALIGLSVYTFLIKPKEEEPPLGEFPEGEEGFIPFEEEFIPELDLKIKAISKEAVLAPTLTNDKTGVIYYSRVNGNVWQSDFNGDNLTQVSDSILENLIKVLWSSDKKEVITIFQDPLGEVSKYFYKHETDKALPLNKYINYVAWSPDVSKIAYQYQNELTDENNISISSPDGSDSSIIIRTRMRNLIVEWPKEEKLFLREKATGLVQSSLYSLSPLTRAFTKVISDIYGFSTKWSTDGEKLLYSKTKSNGKDIVVFVANKDGSNQKTTKVSTLVEKCVWSQDPRIIYCAVPKNIRDAKILPDDFYKGTFLADDDFWKINVETNEKTKILEEWDMPEKYNADDLFLSPQESYLLFVNKINGLLYSVELE